MVLGLGIQVGLRMALHAKKTLIHNLIAKKLFPLFIMELLKIIMFSGSNSKKPGHIFHSKTDTEVIAHFFEALLMTHQTLKGAVIDLE